MILPVLLGVAIASLIWTSIRIIRTQPEKRKTELPKILLHEAGVLILSLFFFFLLRNYM
jgi:integral membrane sensor domain MASE1